MIPLISASAGMMMALPYAILIPMMPRADHGLLTGVYSMSRGVGIVLGPLLAAAAIQAQNALGTPLGTVEYSALWLVAGLLLVASVPLLGGMRRTDGRFPYSAGFPHNPFDNAYIALSPCPAGGEWGRRDDAGRTRRLRGDPCVGPLSRPPAAARPGSSGPRRRRMCAHLRHKGGLGSAGGAPRRRRG